MKLKIKDHLKFNLKSIKKISPAVCFALVCVAQSPSAVATSDGATINPNEVTTANIQNFAVTSDKIAIDAVTTDKIAENVVTDRELADDAVSTSHIQAGAVGTTEIADGAVTSDKFADGAVDGAFIKSGTVTATNSVSLGTGTIADQDNTVSVGSSLQQRRITNVAPGVDANDVATFGQLKNIESKFRDDFDEAYGGIAGVAALSGAVAYPSTAGKTAVGVGFGYFNSESAMAINVSHWVKANQNTRIIINAGASFFAEKSVFKAGASFEF